MIDTNALRKKYETRPNGWTPAGARDVRRLCDALDNAVRLIRDIQCAVSTEDQNDIQTRLWLL